MTKGIFLVTGTAGTGKSTVMRQLASRGYSTIGIDEEPDVVTWINKKTGVAVPRGADLTEEFLREHDWGCDIDKLKKIIETKDRPLVICGSCDNIKEVMKLCEKSMILVCEPDIFLPRLEQRTDNEYGQNEATQKEILGYYQSYRDLVLADGAVKIDASHSLENVVKDIIKEVNEL